MSLLFFYLKIFPKRTVRLLLWATIGYNAIWGVAFILIAVFQCQPIDYYWTNWDGEHTGTCINANSLGWANAITSIALDIWMVAIPLFQLRDLQLHFKKKIGVGIMFCTGTFVTVISIVRLQTLITFANSSNPTWDNLRVSQWSTIEVNVGIMCACMPALRLILVKIFPRLTSTRRGYGTNASWGADNYATGASRTLRSQARVGIESNNTSKSGGGSSVGGGGGWGAGKGITYQRSYTVQFHDAETSSQVHLKDLDSKGLEAQTNVSDWSA
ncbi:hypothetical protein M406DRAFT_355824 [Cryphonectria parasitica EP155]|uniref:Rhodopsin domain-containing protein n=1 Tax=Cryphonectria parasitica (strain ATCC 38755 / EP155) TaxID=660469 RepID=A0A9P4Y7C1_CRYP1|nr:uncharacterized protein M406DRAFT_355824 [Cryphonectria parasitica EP155]KAF3768073.1 hypothetical protein M406DRAFT_355824 [Cryphonectria parasitica EP155]